MLFLCAIFFENQGFSQTIYTADGTANRTVALGGEMLNFVAVIATSTVGNFYFQPVRLLEQVFLIYNVK